MKFIIFAITVLSLGPSALAQDRPGFPGAERGQRGEPGRGRQQFNFESLDKNKDGKITTDEWQGPPEFFERVDANRDGAVTREELEQMRQRGGAQGGIRMLAEQIVRTLDTDQDNKLSATEFAQLSTTAFTKLDRDSDGVLTLEETQGLLVPAGGQGRGGRGRINFDELDKNKDGKLSLEEWPRQPEAFKRLDTNSDGVMSREELEAAATRGPREPREGARQGEGPRRGEGQPGRGRFEFADLDKNKDGKVTNDEWTAPPEAFNRFDTNQDGAISSEEFQAARRGPQDGLRRIAEQLVQVLDGNGDNKLSNAEFGRLVGLFTKLDKDSNGQLTGDELGALLTVANSERVAATGGIDVDQFIKKADQNNDGALSANEVPNAKLFQALDSNKDGVATRDEIATWIRQAEEQKRARQARTPRP